MNSPILLSVILPAYNEEARIGDFLPALVTQLHKDFYQKFEVLVVNDGSTDQTQQLAQSILGTQGTVINQPNNLGKGEAIRRGVECARGTYICITDADGSIGLSTFQTAVEILQVTHAPGIVGTRYLSDQNAKVHLTNRRLIAGITFATITRLLLGLRYSDTQCGFKAFPNSVAKELYRRSQFLRFSIDFEVLFIAKKNRIAFIELPVEWHEKPGSKVSLIKDGLQMLSEIFHLWIRNSTQVKLKIENLNYQTRPMLRDVELDETPTMPFMLISK